MKLSKKYQWMEMPCRTKIGVAGCKNACSSIHSKDIGIIGDKTGLTVTAGGSAGFNPRLADIIASDLTDEGALKLVDKIFEYYKENADMGEKLGFFIERIGIEEFKKEVLR
jgi:NAD(P)H-nitrite reductase large subunit